MYIFWLRLEDQTQPNLLSTILKWWKQKYLQQSNKSAKFLCNKIEKTRVAIVLSALIKTYSSQWCNTSGVIQGQLHWTKLNCIQHPISQQYTSLCHYLAQRRTKPEYDVLSLSFGCLQNNTVKIYGRAGKSSRALSWDYGGRRKPTAKEWSTREAGGH